MATLLIGCLASGSSQAQQITNLIAERNPGFETGTLEPWWTFDNWGQEPPLTATVVKDCNGAAVPEDPIEGNYCLHVKVAGPSSNWWSVCFGVESPTFEKGKKYTLSLWVKSKTGTARINFKPEQNANPWPGYGQQQITATEKWAEYHVTTPVFVADVTPTDLVFHVGFAAQEFWVDDCKFYEGDYVPTQVKNKRRATEPVPGDKAVDVPQDSVLNWKAGPYGNTHDVYLGTSFEDINSADLSKAVSVGQVETTFKPTSLLAFGRTYYWRIDEVNAPPGNTIFKGDIWSFTVEPYVYPIKNITAKASSAQTGMGPERTVDGSGLDKSDGHSTETKDMWLSMLVQPHWIQYEFDKVYALHELCVWNSNSSVEPFIGFGAKTVKIEYSTDGTTWTPLTNVPEFARAPGQPGYKPNTTVSFGGVSAKYVKLTIEKGWGTTPSTGLSEVRFSYVPVQAFAPQPANAATGVRVDTSLNWRPGREAASHQVFFSVDRTAVAAGTVPAQIVTDHRFDPGVLKFGTTYYWRVDEVDAITHPGEVWSFTTQPY
jgi:hypothetical protein